MWSTTQLLLDYLHNNQSLLELNIHPPQKNKQRNKQKNNIVSWTLWNQWLKQVVNKYCILYENETKVMKPLWMGSFFPWLVFARCFMIYFISGPVNLGREHFQMSSRSSIPVKRTIQPVVVLQVHSSQALGSCFATQQSWPSSLSPTRSGRKNPTLFRLILGNILDYFRQLLVLFSTFSQSCHVIVIKE